MTVPTAPDYVVVGHVSKDVAHDATPGGYTLGGTVTYAGLAARRLGLRVGILTSAGPDLDLSAALPDVEVVVVPAAATTTFENVYEAGRRRQHLRARAAPLLPEHVPTAWRDAPIVHFGPLAQEFGPELLDAFSRRGLRGLTPQGWLRRWRADGLVYPVELLDSGPIDLPSGEARRSGAGTGQGSAEPPRARPGDVLGRFDVVVLSEEDAGGDWSRLRQYAAAAPLLAVTQGARGATICRRGRCASYPAFATTEVDPTGAGDVFAAAYLIRLSQTGDPAAAAVFANCAASFAVEGPGASALPDLGQVLARLASRPGGESEVLPGRAGGGCR